MSFTCNCTNNHVQSPELPFFPRNPFQFRNWRLKPPNPSIRRNKLAPLNHLNPSPFHSFISQNPSSFNSSDLLIAPALGLALYLSRLASPNKVFDTGDWILFASPTPFNRFVLLRCPSISFRDADVNERLVKEERHYVTINSGKIELKGRLGDVDLAYQRVCVPTKDGGVISLDWPANLDLEEERGLDTTILLVPGTPQGSMDKNIRSFVVEALERGFFPVVMNPRGCAGSALTTARLFTAADSDDICTAIQYINKARPWTTLMGVGWGYGANMLAKYLAEVGERTPLIAATCIDNPFDLNEATRSSPYHAALDKKLTSGLVHILQTNKELFQGKTKEFDVEKALLANSVRDFEKAVSMVSHGFGTIEEFYSNSSTRDIIGNVKVPALFIQSDDGTVPLFSVPRDSIAENAYTNLLLCSRTPSSAAATSQAVISWCQLLTIEWLTAVELGLLKGRHPLLKDVDVTINPSKGLALVEDRKSYRSDKTSPFLDLTQSRSFDGYSLDPMKYIHEKSDNASGLRFRSQYDLLSDFDLADTSLQLKYGKPKQNGSIDTEVVKEDNVLLEDGEQGQVLKSAQVIMNMLDISMPGTLTEEEKKKVLTAVSQGETLMKALQDAVPEDVRGKLTTAMTGILQAQGTSVKFERVFGKAHVNDALPKSRKQDNFRGDSSSECSEGHHSSNQMKRDDNLSDGSDNTHTGMGEPTGETDTVCHPSDKSQSSMKSSLSQSTRDDGVSSSGSQKEEVNESANANSTNETSKEKAASNIDSSEKGPETGTKPYITNQPEGVGSSGEASIEDKNQNVETVQLEAKEEEMAKKIEEKTHDSSSYQAKMASSDTLEESTLPPVLSEAQIMDKEGNSNRKKDSKNVQPTSDQINVNTSHVNSPTFNVSQALDALTGMDDSTQVAVNSLFGVIENMIDQLEESSGAEKDRNKNEHQSEEKENKHKSQNVESIASDYPPVHSQNGSIDFLPNKSNMQEDLTLCSGLMNGTGEDDADGSNKNEDLALEKNENKDELTSNDFLFDNKDSLKNRKSIPLYLATSSYGDPLNSQYVQTFLFSKMPNKSLDLDTTTALLLDFFPEEDQWKLLEQPQSIGSSSGNANTCEDNDCKIKANLDEIANCRDKFIEPPYAVLDTEKQPEPVREYAVVDSMKDNIEMDDERSEELMQFVKHTILSSLWMEVGRKLNSANMKVMKAKLAKDLENVANAISVAVGSSKEHILCIEGEFHNIDCAKQKIGTLSGEQIIRAITSSVQKTSYLRKVLPVGVIVGSSLAALRKPFNLATVQDYGLREYLTHDEEKKLRKKNYGNAITKEINQVPNKKIKPNHSVNSQGKENRQNDNINKTVAVSAISNGGKGNEPNVKTNKTVVVGAVTAALGASALLVQQQVPQEDNSTTESPSQSFKVKGNHQKMSEKFEELVSEKNQNNIVTSLAEKAMSVASPVVPTKEDGEVDQERLVSMLADLGQKGGMLRLVGKIAMLWGGIRGAMSLTDRLISFLHIAERPLFQRVLGFVSMVLLLWSPIAIPLLPTLVQSWTSGTASKIAQLACIIGLYAAVMILVMLWGKRIRGYDDPFEQYGLDLTSPPKTHDFLKGLVGGVIMVLSIHSANVFFGFASFSGMPSLQLKLYGHMLILAGQGIIMATAIALVEELLFRAWLPQEIAVDLGFYRGILISGLAFSLFQRSLQAFPGLWLLSMALAGVRQRSGGSLSIPIGLRAGIMASSFVLQEGHLLTYKYNFPLWLTGTRPFQPFSGVVGLTFALALATLLYPRQPLQSRKQEKAV